MRGSLTDQCIALAAITQSAMLVHNKASARISHERYGKLMLESIFVQAPDSVRDIYPNPEELKLGLETACALLGQPEPALLQVAHYTRTLIQIGKLLSRQPAMVSKLGEGLTALGAQRDHLEATEVIRRLSQLYQQTLSTLPLRVQVRGQADALQRPEVADHIRALLLAGVRAAWLWRQLGGRRWHLLLRRTRLLRELARMAQLAATH